MDHTENENGLSSNLKREAMEKIKAALGELDREWVDANGSLLKPSQCYRFGIDPPHVLFNTNCPDSLKQRIRSILASYIPEMYDV